VARQEDSRGGKNGKGKGMERKGEGGGGGRKGSAKREGKTVEKMKARATVHERGAADEP